MTTLAALYLYHRRLGYGHRTAMRLARWANDPTQPLHPEKK